MKFNPKKFLSRLWAKVSDDDIIGNAAQVAFYFSFAIFPLLLFLMSLLGVILNDKQDLQEELFLILGQVMPASAYDLVKNTLDEVTKNASGGKLSFGILVTLWSASAGIDNMRSTLNEVYNLKETRSFIRAKLTSLALTLVVGILILVALGFIVYGSQFLDFVLPIDSPLVLNGLEWLIILLMLQLAFALLYNFAPNHDAFKWKWLSPGAIIGVVLWLLLTGGFRLYLRYFDSYAATYGSLGAVIVLMLWLYLTALVILIGGAINAIFDEKSGVKKDAADPKQTREEKTGTGTKSNV